MRALTSISLWLACTTGVFASSFTTRAPFALLVDQSSGKTLFEKNADLVMSPASTTKILTAEVIFNLLASGKLNLQGTFTVSTHAASEGDALSGGSSMFAVAGSQIKIDELLQGLLTDSGNDAAIILAEGIAGSESRFAALMNAQARLIGMRRSHFTNPWGNAGNHVTPRDMFKLAEYVIKKYPQYYSYFGQPEFTWHGIRQQNRNPLLALGADGLKTGHLAASGFGLVASGVFSGHRLVLVINGLKSDKERASEGMRLIDFGKSQLAVPSQGLQ